MTEIISVAEYRELVKKTAKVGPRSGKYNAKRKEVDGIAFDSAGEADYYTRLKLREKAGEITAISRQVKFVLEGGSYRADFVYFEIASRRWVVDDFKGVETKEFKRSKRAMRERYGIDIKISK